MKKNAQDHADVSRDTRFQRIALLCAYAVAVAGAIYVRFLFIPSVLQNPHVTSYDSDAARFYRLIDLIARDYPSLPMFDWFANFPWGMKTQLPPLWAFIEASFALAVGKISGLSVGSSAALAPVVAGLLFCVPAYVATKTLFGKAAGHSAVLLGLFLPVVSVASSVGMVDHHVADLLLYMTTMALLIVAAKHYADKDKAKATVFSALAGLAIAFTLLISLSSILIVVILGIVFLLGFLLLSKDERNASLHIGLVSLGTSGGLLLLLSLSTPWFSKSLSFHGLSLMQPGLLLGFSALIVGSAIIDLLSGENAKRPWFLGSFFCLILLVALAIPHTRDQIVLGFFRSIGSYPLGRETVELQPLFQDGVHQVFFSILLYVMPLGFALSLKDAITSKRLTFGVLLFLTWFVVGGFYVALVRYFRHLFAPAAVMALGILIAKLGLYTGRKLEPLAKRWGSQKIRFAAWLAIVAVLSVYLFAALLSIRNPAGSNRTEMLGWIKDNTPKVSGYYDPSVKPEYGIVATWSLGELAQLVSERPTLATGNQETGIQGIKTLFRFFQSKSEEEAVDLMAENKLRYVWLDNQYPAWVGELDKVGQSGPDPRQIAYRESSIDPRMTNVRLYRFFGGGDAASGMEPLQHFRLLNVVSGGAERPNVFFELVSGASLKVRSKQGTRVTVSTRIEIEDSGMFEWKLGREIGDSGVVEVSLPYPTESPQYPVKAKPYVVSIDKSSTVLYVSERDVATGAELTLPR